jgi:transposase
MASGVVVGVDTHRDAHTACVISVLGTWLGVASFAATASGYEELIAWAEGFGAIFMVGVEGTGAHGAGLTRDLVARGLAVVEINRADRPKRRRRGKSDALDAEQAARFALAGEHAGQPKHRDGAVEAIRSLRVARSGAIKQRTAAYNQLHALVDTADERLRGRLRGLGLISLVRTCAAFRPDPTSGADPVSACKLALRSVARRCLALTEEIASLDRALRPLVAAAAPSMLGLTGVGTDHAAQFLITAGDNPHRLVSEASFAALCGASPVPAASGLTHRHRLSRGGDRQANRALYLIAVCRLRCCPRTRAYAAKRTAQGLSKKDILRCLKRFIAREIYHALHADYLHSMT